MEWKQTVHFFKFDDAVLGSKISYKNENIRAKCILGKYWIEEMYALEKFVYKICLLRKMV